MAENQMNQMTEAQAVDLVRNALVVAGHELGKDGDHWPVIKSTVHSIMRDYEEWEVGKNTFAEVRKHYREMITELRDLSEKCPEESKAQVNALVADLLQLYTACFTPVDRNYLQITEEEFPPHVKRAAAIIDTLEEDDNG